MNYILTLILGLFTLQAFSADATSIKPLNVTAAKQVTVNVLHYKRNIIYQYTSVACPTGSTLIFSDFFTASDNKRISGSTMGYSFYNCMETYWTNDVYYQKLVNNTWTNCDPATGSYMCTIKMHKPPIVQLIGRVPEEGIEPEGTRLTFFQADLRLGVSGSANPSYLAGSTSRKPDITDVIYTWEYEASSTPLYPTVPVVIYWSLGAQNDFEKSEAPAWNLNNTGVWGSWECVVAPSIGFALVLTPDMMGQTCILTCGGRWNVITKVPAPYFWRSYYGIATCH